MITTLKENQVFVFGSNLAGNHAGGAARQALESFGAVQGRGVGMEGRSYAIPTLGYNMEKLPLEDIKFSLEALVVCAKIMPEKEFLLTAIGQGIAGFSKKEIDSIMPTLPNNVIRV